MKTKFYSGLITFTLNAEIRDSFKNQLIQQKIIDSEPLDQSTYGIIDAINNGAVKRIKSICESFEEKFQKNDYVLFYRSTIKKIDGYENRDKVKVFFIVEDGVLGK